MIITENKLAISTFNEEFRLVRSTFSGRFDVTLAIDHLEELGEFYFNNKVNASIVDLSNVYGSYAKVLEYVKTTFLPKTKTSGIKWKAYVVSDDVIVAYLSSKLVEGDEHNKILSKVFSQIKDAEKWVTSII